MIEDHPHYDNKKRKDYEKFYLKWLPVPVITIITIYLICLVVEYADEIDAFFENLIP